MVRTVQRQLPYRNKSPKSCTEPASPLLYESNPVGLNSHDIVRGRLGPRSLWQVTEMFCCSRPTGGHDVTCWFSRWTIHALSRTFVKIDLNACDIKWVHRGNMRTHLISSFIRHACFQPPEGHRGAFGWTFTSRRKQSPLHFHFRTGLWSYDPSTQHPLYPEKSNKERRSGANEWLRLVIILHQKPEVHFINH